MKKILVVCIGSLFLITLSGCSLGDIVDRFSDSEDTQIQDINPGSTRVYMDEIRGTLQYFTGNQLTLLSGSDNYVFDISQATLECADGMLCGDAVSVIYEGQLDSTDTGAVRVLKVVDDYHDTSEVKEGTTRGQVQNLMGSGRTLALHMYVLSSEGLHMNQASATAVVILLFVLLINGLSGMVAKRIVKG